MKRVKYKFIHIRQKYFIQSTKTARILQKIVKQNITEYFKAKQQKSIMLNILTRLLIFLTPYLLQFYSNKDNLTKSIQKPNE